MKRAEQFIMVLPKKQMDRLAKKFLKGTNYFKIVENKKVKKT